jgi:thiamine pyrophosphate-dependent acetolactate synthase large subunit-like protein
MTATVADALLDQLAAHGVRVCFGIPGVHNLPIWNSAGEDGRPRVVGVRHEQAAGYAADALARATGGLGVVLTTTGPGFVNALAAFGEAWTSFSPVLLLSSETPVKPRRTSGDDDGLLHGMRDQAGMVVAGFGARAVSATTGEEALAALPELVAHAMATGRPVYLGVPADVLHHPVPAVVPGPIAVAPTQPDSEAVRAADAALRGRRVALWLGARAVPAEDDLLRLAERLGALVVPAFQARGALASYPGTVQVPAHEPAVADAVAACDVLLVVGDDLCGMMTRNWKMPVPPSIVALVDDATLSLGDYPLEVKVVGDVQTSVAALVASLGEGPAPDAPDGAALTKLVRDEISADPRVADAAAFVSTIETAWGDPDDALVVDMCISGFWACLYTHQPRARRAQYPVGWGTLGFGFPASLGPAADGTATLAVVGDGGIVMGLGELATITQEQLPVVVLVVSNGGYGMLRFDQQVEGVAERGVDLLEPKWDLLAAAYDFRYERTDDPGEGLAAALVRARTALDAGERTLLVLDAAFHPPRTTSPRWSEGPVV